MAETFFQLLLPPDAQSIVISTSIIGKTGKDTYLMISNRLAQSPLLSHFYPLALGKRVDPSNGLG